MLYQIKKHKKILAVLMVLAMTIFVFTGCGPKMTESAKGGAQTDETEGNNNESQDKEAEGRNIEDTVGTADSNAMGRYVETSTDMSEYCSMPKGVVRLADGMLVIFDRVPGRIVSKDNGVSWSGESQDWQTENWKDGYHIMDVAYGVDGTAGMIYTVPKDEAAEEDDDFDDNTEKKCLIAKPTEPGSLFRLRFRRKNIIHTKYGFQIAGEFL